MKRILPACLTEAQMVQLVLAPDVATAKGRRDRAILATLCATGLRASELCDLRAADLQPPVVFVRAGKGGHQRYVPISAKALEAVQAYLAARPARGDEPLFRTLAGAALSRRLLHKLVTRYQRALRLPRGVHLLRHSAATRWLNRGISLPAVQALLGHVQLQTTAVYLHTATVGLVREYRRCLETRRAA